MMSKKFFPDMCRPAANLTGYLTIRNLEYLQLNWTLSLSTYKMMVSGNEQVL